MDFNKAAHYAIIDATAKALEALGGSDCATVKYLDDRWFKVTSVLLSRHSIICRIHECFSCQVDMYFCERNGEPCVILFQLGIEAFRKIVCLADVKPVPKEEPKPMFTYFISDGEFVKIGKSANPQARFASLQTSNPKKLELLAVYPGDVEADLHKAFAEQRVSGEWFRLTPGIQKLIGEMKS